MAYPVVLYKSETWTLVTWQLKIVQAADMEWFRRPSAGCTLHSISYSTIMQNLYIRNAFQIIIE